MIIKLSENGKSSLQNLGIEIPTTAEVCEIDMQKRTIRLVTADGEVVADHSPRYDTSHIVNTLIEAEVYKFN